MSLRRPWAILLCSLLLAGCTQKNSQEPIPVGHLLPMTGDDRAAGEQARQGMTLALEEVNAEDRRVGGRTVLVRNVDSRGDPETVQAEAVRLLTLNKVVALVASLDAKRAERVVQTASPYSVPVVVAGELPGPAPEGVVSLGAGPAARGAALARFAAQELKAKHVVVLTDQRSPVATALAAAFKKEWPRNNPPTIDEWNYHNDSEQIDFATRLAAAAPSAVLVAGTPADFLKLQGQLFETKWSAPLLYGGADVDAATFRHAAGEMYRATAYDAEGLTERGKEFAKRYEDQFHEPPGLDAAQTYDAGRLLFETMERVKNGSAARVREELGKDDFQSVTGPVTWKDRQPRRAVFVVQSRNGESKLARAFNPNSK